jgi:hypothetical protein
MAFSFRRPGNAAQVWLPDEDPDSDKARLQESEICKNPKYVVELLVTNSYPGGFWEDYGYNWFSGS